jgi:hypothetical protein
MVESDHVRNEALTTIRGIISRATICMMTNNILEWSLQPGSLENQWMDPNGNIWFLGFGNVQESPIAVDGRMELFYSDRSRSRFLSLVGEVRPATFEEGEMVQGFPFLRQQLREVSTPVMLARFSPYEASYWDELTADMVPLDLSKQDSHSTQLPA